MGNVLRVFMMMMILSSPLLIYGEECEQTQTDTLELRLTLEDINLPQQRILVKLTVTNMGESVLFLPRLREGYLEKFEVWWAWKMSILHPQKGRFRFHEPKGATERNIMRRCQQGTLTEEECYRYLFPSELDIIELSPGENISVTINIAHAKRFDDESREQPFSFEELYTIPGSYAITAIFQTGVATPDIYFWKGGWTCPTTSNQIIIEIEEKSDE